MVNIGSSNSHGSSFQTSTSGSTTSLAKASVPSVKASKLAHQTKLKAYAVNLLARITKRNWPAVRSLLDRADSDSSISMDELGRIVNTRHPKHGLNSMHLACMYGAPASLIEDLVLMRADLNATGSVFRKSDRQQIHEASALHIAIAGKFFDAAKVLVSMGHSTEVQNGLGETPLIAYLKEVRDGKKADLPFIRSMVSSYSKVELRDLENNSALGLCTENNIWSVADALMDKHIALLETEGEVGLDKSEARRCIFHAIRDGLTEDDLYGKLAVLKVNANEAADSVSESDSLEWNTIKNLFLKRLNPWQMDWSALENLLTQSERHPALVDKGVIDSLVNARDKHGKTLLHVMAEYDAPASLVEKFIQLGADVNATAYQEYPIAGMIGGMAPLHFAVEGKGESPIVDTLLDAGAEVDKQNSLGETPLALHISDRGIEFSDSTVFKLLQAGADYSNIRHRGDDFLTLVRNSQHWTLYVYLHRDNKELLPEIISKQYEIELDGKSQLVDYRALISEIQALGEKLNVNVRAVIDDAKLMMQLVNPDQDDTSDFQKRSDELEFIEEDEYGEMTSSGTLDIAELMSAMMAAGDYLAYGLRGRNSEFNRLYQVSGDPYEAYLYLKAFEEGSATRKKPTLSETKFYPLTRLLRNLLFVHDAQSINGMISRTEFGSTTARAVRAAKWHPHIAEYMAMLNHPKDTDRSDSNLGTITSALSSYNALIKLGRVTGAHVYNWGRIGTLTFSFQRWRFDAERTWEYVKGEGMKPVGKSLIEKAGFKYVSNRDETDFWTNPETGKREHLLGPGYVLRPGVMKGGFFDRVDGKSVYNFIAEETLVELRRAYLLVSHPDEGTLIIRNSSTVFGRDKLLHPAYWSHNGVGRGFTERDLINLTQKQIENGFNPILSETPFVEINSVGFLLDQLEAVTETYSRMKYDTDYETAWDRSKEGEDALIGGYKSPLFKDLVYYLTQRYRDVKTDELMGEKSRKVLPVLAACNSRHQPWSPYAKLELSDNSISALNHLVEHGWQGIGKYQAQDLEQFLRVLMEQQCELVLLAN